MLSLLVLEKMVNKEIVNYLREGKRRGFTIERLKQELLKNGFNPSDVDEAVKIVEENQRSNVNNKNIPVANQQSTGNFQNNFTQSSNSFQNNQILRQPTNFEFSELKQASQPNIIKDHSKLLNQDEEKSNKGTIIVLIIIFLLLVGAGVAVWIFRDAIMGWLG